MTSTANPNVANNEGWTPIHAAAIEGQTEVLKLLVPKVEDPNAPHLEVPLRFISQHDMVILKH